MKDGIRCDQCGNEYQFEDGILRLLPANIRTDYSLTSGHGELNRRAVQIGWKKAVQEHVRNDPGSKGEEYVTEYINSEARADFRVLLPVDENSIVIDVGSGWGNISTAFARTSKLVVAVDTNTDNLRFVSARAAQEGIKNIIVVQGDACSFPVKANSCDAVTMVGVLEWVAWGRNDRSPRILQKKALELAFDSLKPGGCLYLALENRYSFKYFLGVKEPHTQLRFVSLLPDPVAQCYSKFIRGKEYQEITYSLPELKRLLRSVGFNSLDIYFPIPGYQNFRFITQLDDKKTIAYTMKLLQSYPRFGRLLRLASRLLFFIPLRTIRFFWPSFSIVAKKA
jgi:2-polyprenyl-3-methyl-5-hydroxy-6-metoxy-1,4-benzoquinol methylase